MQIILRHSTAGGHTYAQAVDYTIRSMDYAHRPLSAADRSDDASSAVIRHSQRMEACSW